MTTTASTIRRARRLAAGLLLAAGVVATGCGDGDGPALRFEARAGDVEGGGDLTAGLAPDERVRVRLPGETYDPPLEVERPASREEAARGTPREASASHFGAFSADDAAWIVANYAPGEREEIRRLVEEQAMEAHGLDVLADYESKRIHGRARLEVADTAYELLVVSYRGSEGEERWLIEPFVQQDGAWYRTDVLAGNPRYEVVQAAFRSGQITSLR